MAESFNTVITNLGLNKIANAIKNDEDLDLAYVQIGDSNGEYYEPSEDQTELVHGLEKIDINSKRVVQDEILVEAIIPAELGGFYIREAALFNSADELIAVAKIPETYKPAPEEGSVKALSIRFDLKVSNADKVSFRPDTDLSFATVEQLENLKEEVKENLFEAENKIAEGLKYEKARGTATELELTLPDKIPDGFIKYFIATSDNNKESTTINGIPLYKPNTQEPVELKAGQPYQIYYSDDTNSQFGGGITNCFFLRSNGVDLSKVTVTPDKMLNTARSYNSNGELIKGNLIERQTMSLDRHGFDIEQSPDYEGDIICKIKKDKDVCITKNTEVDIRITTLLDDTLALSVAYFLWEFMGYRNLYSSEENWYAYELYLSGLKADATIYGNSYSTESNTPINSFFNCINITSKLNEKFDVNKISRLYLFHYGEPYSGMVICENYNGYFTHQMFYAYKSFHGGGNCMVGVGKWNDKIYVPDLRDTNWGAIVTLKK